MPACPFAVSFQNVFLCEFSCEAWPAESGGEELLHTAERVAHLFGTQGGCFSDSVCFRKSPGELGTRKAYMKRLL
ncbi:Hypothetical predicted protein [Podarcis lilfordi]|uniref:Uncharacterized protein n=1 Tax=Podarcis lilfordi TaxID=74358 RepID=A0AA35PFB7_9SAUR|nr:Hypothetical predicted protein [Podarcis lilfordi]